MEKEGLAIIFNHFEFDPNNEIEPREGTKEDEERLKPCLENLNFKVETHLDLTLQEIEKVIQKVANLKSSDISCLIIVVMTHGEPGKLQAYDTMYDIDTLWKDLTSDKCPGLIGVPKLYFIQACRGNKANRGNLLPDFDDDKKITFTMPSMTDFLQMYSTYEDHLAWRGPEGSWFIQSLCEVLENEAENYDLMQLLTLVNKKVAVDFETNAKIKQIPQLVSMLTKILKFNTNADRISSISEIESVNIQDWFLRLRFEAENTS